MHNFLLTFGGFRPGLGACEAYPGGFGAFGGYGDDMTVSDGWMALPDAPGHGFERHAGFMALARPMVADLLH